MTWYVSLFSIILLATTGFDILVTITLWRHRHVRGALALMLMMLAIAEWAALYAFEIIITDITTKVLLAKFEYIGIVTTPLLFLVFSVQYNNRENWLSRRKIIFLSVLPALTLIVAFTNEYHQLLWTSFTPIPDTTLITYGHGWWFFVAMGNSYLYSISAIVLILRTAFRFRYAYRRQAIGLFASALIPLASSIPYIFDFGISGLDITPIILTIMGINFMLLIYKFQLFELVPVTRDVLIDKLQDGILVLDSQKRITDVNSAALRFLKTSLRSLIGQQIEAVLADWPKLAMGGHVKPEKIGVILETGEIKTIEIFFSDLNDINNKTNNSMVTMRDVTEQEQAAESIKKSEEIFHKLFDANPFPVAIIRFSDTKIMQSNQAVKNFFEIDPSEQSGLDALSFYINPKGRASILNKVAKKGKANGRVIEMKISPSKKKWALANIFPFEYEHEPCLLMGWADITESRRTEEELKNYRNQLETLVKDRTTELSYTNEVLMSEMSERRHVEQTLRDSEEELRILLGALTDVIMVISSEGRYIKIAPTNTERLFRPPEFLMGKTFHDVFPVETANMFLNYVTRTLETKQAVNTEYPMLMGNSQVWFSAIISPLTDNQVIWVARDITYLKQTETALRQYQGQLEDLVRERTNELAQTNTQLVEEINERTRAELELRTSEERYQTIVEQQTDLISHWAPDTILTFVNKPYCQYFGKSIEDLIGTSFLQFITTDNMKTVRGIVQRVLTEESGLSTEERMTLPDGSVRWLLWSYKQIYGANDDLIEIQSVGRDITDRKRAEIAESEQRMLAETLRAANLSLTQSLDLKTICDRLLDYLELTISYDSATIFLLDGDNHLTAQAIRGYEHSGYLDLEEALLITFTPEIGTNLHNLIEKREVIIIPDISSDEGWIHTPASSHIRSWLGVPMVVGDKVIGICSLDSTRTNFFSEEHTEIVKALGAQAAFAIQNAHLFETTQRYARETETLQKIMLAVSTSLNFNQVMNILLEQIGTIIHSDSASITLVDGEDMVLSAFRGPNAKEEIVLGSRWARSRSPLERTVKEQRPIHFPDIQAEYEIFREAPHNKIRSVLVTPLVLKGEVIGILNLDSWQLNHFSNDDERLAALFASQVSIAIENANLYEASQRQLKEQSILYEINHILTSTLDLDELLEFTYQQVHRFIVSRLFMVAKYDQRTDEWVSLLLKRDDVNLPPISHKSSEGMSGYVIQSREPLFLRNSTETEDFCRRTNRQSLQSLPKSAMLAPLIIKDKVIGVMGAQNDDIEDVYSQQDFNLFCSISTQIAIAFENAILYAEMEKLAITDSLTGLFNRRHFFLLASNEFERAVRYDKSLSVIMIDIDHFKKVNDTYGHSVGDQVLQNVAHLCEQGLRRIDIIGRYGGEEFVIALPETDVQSAQEAAERLRLIFSETPINTSRGFISIAISLGVATMDASHPHLEGLLDCADQALYSAKQEGRNRVKVYQLIEE